MTRIGLVSDSHGRTHNLKKAIDQMGKVDMIFHMGDYIEDADMIKTWTSTPVMAVKGNMDMEVPGHRPSFIKTKVEGCVIYATHGHMEHVKWGINDLIVAAKRKGCNIALYGHTHRKDFDRIDNVVVVNPGSCSLPNDGTKSYAVMTIDGKNVVSLKFYDIDDDESDFE